MATKPITKTPASKLNLPAQPGKGTPKSVKPKKTQTAKQNPFDPKMKGNC